MEAKHTKGPWTIDNGPKSLDADHRLFEIHSLTGGKTNDGNVIAIVVGDIFDHTVPLKNQAEANARLIAAAPDLLEACKKAYNTLSEARDLATDDENFDPTDIDDTLNKIHAACSKATGTK